jgi:hypothetical protein
MTKQEADFIGSMNMCDEISNEAYKKIMCNCEVEEQQPLHGYKIDMFTPTAQAWLSSFNTDSATECFTAVQELKERLEDKK